VVRGDVRNYLRLGNVAWEEGRLARALEHYQRATEVEPAEPRAWHNLAVCRYYLARKSNPDDIEGAVRQAYEPLRSANRSDVQYGPALATLEYFAELLKLLEDIE
jgi:tetratricopeptide (TPR) repeat protein